MILKYPIFLLLIIPIIAIFYFFRVEKITHAIQFPKTALLGPLASKKATRILFLTQLLELIIIFLIIFTLTQPQFIRAKKFNAKCYVVTESVILHKISKSIGGNFSLKKNIRKLRSTLKLINIHSNFFNKLTGILGLVIISIIHFPKILIHHSYKKNNG